MAIKNSAMESLKQENREVRESGNTKKELDWLKKIIETDNINFSEKSEYKDLIELDSATDTLFDSFMKTNQNQIKWILNSQDSADQKRQSIQNLFSWFLLQISDKNFKTDDYELNKAIWLFNYFKQQAETNQSTIINITEFKLNNLNDEVLKPISWQSYWWSPYSSNPTYWWWYHMSQNTESENKTKKESRKEKREKEKEDKTKTDNNENTKVESNENVVNVYENKYEEWNYKMKEDHIENYQKTELYESEKIKKLAGTEQNIEDIYKDNRVQKVLQVALNDDWTTDIKKNHLYVNLSVEDGLAGVINQIGSYIKNNSIKIDEDNTVYDIILARDEKNSDDPILKDDAEKIKAKDVKKIFSLPNFNYKPEEGDEGENDYRQIAKIFNKVQRKDLKTFADVMKSRANDSRVLKEWHNNKIVIEEWLIDQTNMFGYLSDINSDWVLSTDDKPEKNEQFKYWDLGNITWPQLNFTIEQAIKTQNAILWEWEWEKIVSKNIGRMISTMLWESRDNPQYLEKYWLLWAQWWDLYSNKYINALNDLDKDPSKAKLLKILNDYPQSKQLFLAAIEKISGWSQINQTDLYDVLTGQESKRIEEINTIDEVEAIRKTLDRELRRNKDFQKFVEDNWVEIRESLLQQIMEKIDTLAIQISFDIPENQKMIMSEASKNLYREKAKKTMLSNFNIQQLTIWTNTQDIKIAYQIGNSVVSKDKKTIYHMSWGPSFYLWKNWIWAWLEASFSYGKMVNRHKVVSAQLNDVIKNPATYMWVEWALGWKIGTKWLGAYANVWIFAQTEHLTWIHLVEKVYSSVTGRIFDVQWLRNYSKDGIKSYLEANLKKLETAKNWDYVDFVKNNKQKLLEDIRLTTELISNSKVLEEINKQITSDEKKQWAISSFLRMVQQWNIDQWKSDVTMNLQDKKAITKLWVGFNASTWAVWIRKNKTTWSSTTWDNWELPTNNDEQISPEWSWTWGDIRLSFLGVYVGARFSTWKNKYLPNAGQLKITERDINEWKIDEIQVWTDLEKYAKYLEWLFNKTGLTVKKIDWKLEISYASDLGHEWSITKILNIHYTTDVQDQFIVKGNKLIIGNVWPIAAYTTALPGWVDRVICLGTSKLGEAIRLTWENTPANDIEDIKFNETGLEDFSKTKLDQTIDELKNSANAVPSAADISFYKSLFDQNGKLVTAPTWVTYWSGLVVGQKFATWTLTLYKKANNTYVLDYKQNTDIDDKKLHMNYKVVSTWNRAEVTWSLKEDPNLWMNVSGIVLPEAEDIAGQEKWKNRWHFTNFIWSVINWNNNEAAEKHLLKIIGENSDEWRQLKNWTIEEKQYIIDSYVSLFAYEKSYENVLHSSNLIWSDKRKNGINYLKISDNQFKNELVKIKQDIIKDSYFKETSFNDLERETYDNIFWYTAFYRTITWPAATLMWKTNIVKESMTDISEENQKAAKERIVQKLSKDENHTEHLINQIKKNIDDDNVKQYLTSKNLWELITKWELEIPWNTIDISSKKLILKSHAIFYLLGECLNESIWLRIEEIKIEEWVDAYTAEKEADKKYNNLLWRSHSVSWDIHSERYDFSLRATKNLPPGKNKWDNWEGRWWEDNDLPPNEDEQITWE